MKIKKLTLLITAVLLAFGTSIASADKGDKIEHHLDRKADRARDAGKDGLADHLDRKGDRIDRRLDRKGQRINRRHQCRFRRRARIRLLSVEAGLAALQETPYCRNCDGNYSFPLHDRVVRRDVRDSRAAPIDCRSGFHVSPASAP